MKRLSELGVGDFQISRVWQFETGLGDDALYLTPVRECPVSDLRNRVVGGEVRLRNGKSCWAILGNIVLCDARATKHFLTLSIEEGGRWYDLARYHDVDYAQRGPGGLAGFLRLPLSEVFPIQYDISSVASGRHEVTSGSVDALPAETLSEDELIELALKS